MTFLTTRRAFFGLLAAPAIVKAVNLMPIKVYEEIVQLRSPVKLVFGEIGEWQGFGWKQGGAKTLMPGKFSIDGVLMTPQMIDPDPGTYTQIMIPSKPDWGPTVWLPRPSVQRLTPEEIAAFEEDEALEAMVTALVNNEEEARVRRSWRGLLS